MKVKEIRELTSAELVAKEKELRAELFNLRFQLATGQLSNTAQIRKAHKTIARIKTVQRQRELEEEGGK